MQIFTPRDVLVAEGGKSDKQLQGIMLSLPVKATPWQCCDRRSNVQVCKSMAPLLVISARCYSIHVDRTLNDKHPEPHAVHRCGQGCSATLACRRVVPAGL